MQLFFFKRIKRIKRINGLPLGLKPRGLRRYLFLSVSRPITSNHTTEFFAMIFSFVSHDQDIRLRKLSAANIPFYTPPLLTAFCQ